MRNKIQPDRSRNPMRTALAILLAVSMVLGGTITDGWLPSYAEDALSALGIRNRNEVSGQLLTAEGDDYTIHLDYKEDILPEHATLTAEELLPETEIYGKLAAPDPEAEPFRLFKITVTADDADLEPAEQVTATVTWKNTPATSLAGRESVSLYDAHATEESANPEATDAAAIITDNGDGNTAITFSMKAPAIVKLPAAPAPTATAQDTEAAENQNTPAATNGAGETEAVTEQTAGEENAEATAPVENLENPDLTSDKAIAGMEDLNAANRMLNPVNILSAPLTTASGVETNGSIKQMKVGETLSISGSGTKEMYHWWESGSKDLATVEGTGAVGTVTAKAKGTVTITHIYGSKNSKTHSKNSSETFTVEIEEDSTPGGDTHITEPEAAAQDGSLSLEGLTVSVKETGQLKKLNGYHVAVESADGNYSADEDFLKAYHIYLADENGAEVQVPSEELKNGGKNLNLQVTLTYTNPPDWLAQAKDIRHYKNKTNRTKQYIKIIKIDTEKGTVSFIVHGFSDFVFVKNPSDDPTGVGDDFLLSKMAASTGVENEYEITLKVNPKISWPYKQEIVEKSFEEIMYTTGIAIKNNASTTESTEVEGPLVLDGTPEDIFNKAKDQGGANTGLLMESDELAKKYATKKDGKLYEVNKIVIGDTTVQLEKTFYVRLPSFSNNTSIWLFPNGKYVKLTVGYTGTQDPEDKSHYTNGTLTFSNTMAKTLLLKAAEEYIARLDEGNWTKATIAKPDKVTDPMGRNISFLSFTGIDGTSATGHKSTSSYSAAEEQSNEITWKFNEKLQGNSNNDYEKKDGVYYLTNGYELKYRIRLDVQKTGFTSTNPNDRTPTWYKTNGTTILTKSDNTTQNFEVPEVTGILYDLKFKKVNDQGEPLKDATFVITGSGNNGAVTYVNSASEASTAETKIYKTAASGSDGCVVFSDLPWGTYTIQELNAPDEYQVSTVTKTVTLCYTTNEGDLIPSTENSTHLMNSNWNSEDLKFVNTKKETPITGLSINTASGRMAATGVAFAGLLALMWVVRRRLTKFM